MNRPIASLSLDLDNQWSYMKTHGDDGWEKFPSYLDSIVPRFLDFFEKHDASITVFVVGKDAELPKNHDSLRSIAAANHEIGNHSFMHEPWLHLYSRQQIVDEFDRSDEAIQNATGQKCVGFRGPGFTFSKDVLEEMVRREYLYDASTFPTFIGPMAKAYYLLKSSFNRQQKQDRKDLFGNWKEVFRSNRPHLWRLEKQLFEIPVTTIPILKSPFHGTYLSYLASYSMLAARRYFDLALSMCRLTRTAPSFLFHPLDFMDEDDCPELSFFPGMKLGYEKKLDLFDWCISKMARYYRLAPMREHAKQLAECSLRTLSAPASVQPLK